MSKKSGWAVLALTILAGAVIFFGRQHVENEKTEMVQKNGQTASVSAEERPKTDSTEQSVEGVSNEDDVHQLSLEGFLKYKADQENKVTLTYYGDINLDRSSFIRWNNHMYEKLGERFMIEDQTYPGYDTYELYIEQTTAALSSIESDVILFSLNGQEDKARDMGLAETAEYLTLLIDRIHSVAPEALIIFIEPHVMAGTALEWNSRSLSYDRYLETMQEVLTETNVPVFSLHADFAEQLAARGLSVENILKENGVELNEEGEELYFQLFTDWSTRELDISSYFDT